MAERYGVSNTALSLSFCASFSEMSTVIPGIKTTQQAEENTRDVVQLSRDDRMALQELYKAELHGVVATMERQGELLLVRYSDGWIGAGGLCLSLVSCVCCRGSAALHPFIHPALGKSEGKIAPFGFFKVLCCEKSEFPGAAMCIHLRDGVIDTLQDLFRDNIWRKDSLDLRKSDSPLLSNLFCNGCCLHKERKHRSALGSDSPLRLYARWADGGGVDPGSGEFES